MTTTITDPRRADLWERSVVADAALDADALAELWHPEGAFRIGTLPPARGREAVRSFFADFFDRGMFAKLEHEMVEVFDLPEALVYHATAVYTRPDGSELRVPYVNIVKYREGLFHDYRVFIDTAALFGAPA